MPLRIVRIQTDSLGHGIQFRWSSIFSGAFAAAGLGLFFLLLGNAVGLSASNIISPASAALRFWSWVYFAVTMVLSYFLGSMICTRSNEIKSVASGGLHGLAAWAVASTFVASVAVFASPTARAILQGTGPSTATWLAVCIIGLGFFAALMGGMAGKEATRYVRTEGTPASGTEVKTREVA